MTHCLSFKGTVAGKNII